VFQQDINTERCLTSVFVVFIILYGIQFKRRYLKGAGTLKLTRNQQGYSTVVGHLRAGNEVI